MTSLHAFATFVTIDGSPSVVVAYTCICGMHGTYAVVERHIAESSAPERTHDDTDTAVVHDASPIDDDAFGNSNTKAHYLPNEPRRPAPPTPAPPVAPPCRSRGCLAPLNSGGTCTVHFHEVASERVRDPESLPPLPNASRSIAESFQDLLRQAFTAGLAAAQTEETFETWYQREVLQ